MAPSTASLCPRRKDRARREQGRARGREISGVPRLTGQDVGWAPAEQPGARPSLPDPHAGTSRVRPGRRRAPSQDSRDGGGETGHKAGDGVRVSPMGGRRPALQRGQGAGSPRPTTLCSGRVPRGKDGPGLAPGTRHLMRGAASVVPSQPPCSEGLSRQPAIKCDPPVPQLQKRAGVCRLEE